METICQSRTRHFPLQSSPADTRNIQLDLFLAVLSETTDSTEEEWQSIADLATACRSILEALSREGEDQFCFIVADGWDELKHRETFQNLTLECVVLKI